MSAKLPIGWTICTPTCCAPCLIIAPIVAWKMAMVIEMGVNLADALLLIRGASRKYLSDRR